MGHFASKYAFEDFVKTVRTDRRFIFDGKAGDFLEAVRKASPNRLSRIGSGKRLFRAQSGSVLDSSEIEGGPGEQPFSAERMVPEPRFIKNGGRANPPGFAYLYLATTIETALAEMRPRLGDSLSVAHFELLREVTIVVCRAGQKNYEDILLEENPSSQQIDECVWTRIGKAFGRPVNQESDSTSYLPTQILAELFKAMRFDGVAYQSGLERGTNIVLFDTHCAKVAARFLYCLKKIRYDFEGIYPYIPYDKSKGNQWFNLFTESP